MTEDTTRPQPTPSAEVEALAQVLVDDAWEGHVGPLLDVDLEDIARAILSSDWLAAYVQAARDEVLEQYQPHGFIERRIGVRRPDGSVEPIEIGERIDTRDTPLISVERDVTSFQAQASPWREARGGAR